jgi:hypothetical protein
MAELRSFYNLYPNLILSFIPKPKVIEKPIINKKKKTYKGFLKRYTKKFFFLFLRRSKMSRKLKRNHFYKKIDFLILKKLETFFYRKEIFFFKGIKLFRNFHKTLQQSKILRKTIKKIVKCCNVNKFNLIKTPINVYVTTPQQRIISCGKKKKAVNIFGNLFHVFSKVFKLNSLKQTIILNNVYKRLIIRTAIKNTETKKGFKQVCTYLTEYSEIKCRINLFFFDLYNSICRKKNKKSRLKKVKDIISSNFLTFALKEKKKKQINSSSFFKVFLEINKLLLKEIKFRGALKEEYRHYLLEMFFTKFRKFRRRKKTKKNIRIKKKKKTVKKKYLKPKINKTLVKFTKRYLTKKVMELFRI